MKIAAFNFGSLLFKGVNTPYKEDMAFILKGFPMNLCDRTNTINPFLVSIFPLLDEPMKYQDFNSIVKTRARELSSHSYPYVLYSGGLDSTLVVVSLLETQLKNLTVSMTEAAKFENLELYDELVKAGVKLDWNLKSLRENSKSYFIIDGSCSDSLFGFNIFGNKLSSISEFESYLKSQDSIRGPAFYKRLTDAIEKSEMTNFVKSLSDLEIWLANYWNYQAEFFYLKHLMDEALNSTSFFNTDAFRIWGANNCRSFKDHHKEIIRNYIAKLRPEWEFPYFKFKKQSAQLLNSGTKMKNPIFDTDLNKLNPSEVTYPTESFLKN